MLREASRYFLGGGGIKKNICLLVYDDVHWRRRQATEMNKNVHFFSKTMGIIHKDLFISRFIILHFKF